ncbi:MAG: ComEA family DNA-binding protein [Bacillota bacterium]|nr:ComEA family DNA-binding protein [Bacillota bacterium]
MVDKIGFREKVVLIAIVLLLLSGGVWRAAEFSKPRSGLITAGMGNTPTVEDFEPELITVHLVGAAVNPGVYHLPAGSRVYELLDLSGGFRPEADREALNLARPLLDGEQIYIPLIGEVSQRASGEMSKININQATAAELTALPGIGEVRAEQIVAHRESNGFFTDITEIMDVSGIGEATFNNLADRITIY